MGRKTGRKMDQAALSADKGKKGGFFSAVVSREKAGFGIHPHGCQEKRSGKRIGEQVEMGGAGGCIDGSVANESQPPL